MPKNQILNKRMLFLVLLLAVLNCGLAGSPSSLRDVCKKGVLPLDPDPAFGGKTDWKAMFYHTFTDLTVAPDGSVFVASSRQHKIFKFDSQGTLIKTFGRKGQGPGDFNGPGDLSILDNTFLVVGEYALSYRISLFDLEGNIVKVLKTRHSTYRPIALRGGKVAYMGKSFRREGSREMTVTSVLIKDIQSGEEILAAQAETPFYTFRLKSGVSVSFGNDTCGELFIARSQEGNLIVGNSLEDKLDTYSPEGVRLSSFPLHWSPIPVDKTYIKRFKEHQIRQIEQSPNAARVGIQNRIIEFKKLSFDRMFTDHLPYYKEMLVDEEGNILLFPQSDCFDNCPKTIRVYSPQGQFIGEFEIKEGGFSLPIDNRIKNMCFTRDGLYCLAQVREEEDFELRLIKIDFNT